jgi:hypothetical protein
MWQPLFAVFAFYFKPLEWIAFNRIAHKNTIRDSLILHFAKPYIHLSWDQRLLSGAARL